MNVFELRFNILPPSDGGDIAGEGSFPIWERNFDSLRNVSIVDRFTNEHPQVVAIYLKMFRKHIFGIIYIYIYIYPDIYILFILAIKYFFLHSRNKIFFLFSSCFALQMLSWPNVTLPKEK